MRSLEPMTCELALSELAGVVSDCSSNHSALSICRQQCCGTSINWVQSDLEAYWPPQQRRRSYEFASDCCQGRRRWCNTHRERATSHLIQIIAACIGDMGPILEITEMLLLRAELQPIRNTIRLITTDKVIRIVYKYKKIIRV